MAIIDIEQNAASLKIPKDIYLRILGKAITQTQGDLVQCEQALSGDDFVTVQSVAHRLKGDYANMRITVLSEIAKQMNDIAKMDKDKTKLQTLLEQFKGTFAEVQNYFQGLKPVS